MNEESTAGQGWVGGVCIKDNQVLLIHRINNEVDFNKEYFVFPGKKLQGDETLELALTKAFKDFSITIELRDLLYSKGDDVDDLEYYYICKYIFGEPALTPESDEAREMEKGMQVYTPIWVKVSEIEDLIIYPESVKIAILENLVKQ